MRDEKEERIRQGQTNNKAKQHSTRKAVTFPKKNELPRMGLNMPGLLLHTELMVSLFIRCTMRCEIWAQPAELPCSDGRALCLEYRVSWVRVPPEAAHFF